MRAAACLVAALASAPMATSAQPGAPTGRSAAIWAGACHYCHDTGVAPPLRGAKPDPAAVAAIVRSGLPGMPSFHRSEIDDRDLAALARWLHDTPPPPTPPAKKP